MRSLQVLLVQLHISSLPSPPFIILLLPPFSCITLSPPISLFIPIILLSPQKALTFVFSSLPHLFHLPVIFPPHLLLLSPSFALPLFLTLPNLLFTLFFPPSITSLSSSPHPIPQPISVLSPPDLSLTSHLSNISSPLLFFAPLIFLFSSPFSFLCPLSILHSTYLACLLLLHLSSPSISSSVFFFL